MAEEYNKDETYGVKEYSKDEIYGMDLEEYAAYHGITIDDLIKKQEKDVELLKARLDYLVYRNDSDNNLTNEVYNQLERKKENLRRYKEWKRSKKNV
jgi:hypothetical protein